MRWPMLVFALFLLGCGEGAYAVSFFEGDEESWTLANNGGMNRIEFNREGGNPGGHVCGADRGDQDVWYFVAPTKFSGNASSTYGLRLTFDLRQGANFFGQVRGRDVVLNGGGLGIVANLKFAPGLDWTPFSFRLDDQSGWTIDDQTGRGPPATAEDIRTVLGALDTMRIRGDYTLSLDDTACLDNVYLGRNP